MTYHSLEVAGGRSGNHIHEATCTVGRFDLMLCETFKILTNGVDLTWGRGRFGGWGISVHQGKSSLRILTEVECMETAGGGHELQES